MRAFVRRHHRRRIMRGPRRGNTVPRPPNVFTRPPITAGHPCPVRTLLRCALSPVTPRTVLCAYLPAAASVIHNRFSRAHNNTCRPPPITIITTIRRRPPLLIGTLSLFFFCSYHYPIVRTRPLRYPNDFGNRSRAWSAAAAVTPTRIDTTAG